MTERMTRVRRRLIIPVASILMFIWTQDIEQL